MYSIRMKTTNGTEYNIGDIVKLSFPKRNNPDGTEYYVRTPFSIWSLIGHLATRIWPARYLEKQYLGTGTLLRGTRIQTFEFGL